MLSCGAHPPLMRCHSGALARQGEAPPSWSIFGLWCQLALSLSQPSLPNAATVPVHRGRALEPGPVHALAGFHRSLSSLRKGRPSRLLLRSSWTPRCFLTSHP